MSAKSKKSVSRVARNRGRKPQPQQTSASTLLFNLKPAKAQREPREGTKRAKVLQLLHRGTTLERVMKAVDWDRKTAYDGVRLINTRLGFGLKQTADGTIRVYA